MTRTDRQTALYRSLQVFTGPRWPDLFKSDEVAVSCADTAGKERPPMQAGARMSWRTQVRTLADDDALVEWADAMRITDHLDLMGSTTLAVNTDALTCW